MGLSAADLAAAQNTILQFLPNTATNSRTNVTVPCRLTVGTGRQMRLKDAAPYDFKKARSLVMPVGQDVALGDVYTVTAGVNPGGAGMGTYVVTQVLVPISYEAQTEVECFQTIDANGNAILAFIPNATVSFNNPSAPGTDPITVAVFLDDASKDAQLYPDAARYKLSVQYAATLAYSDGKLVSAGHEITWTQPNGVSRTETLSKPRYTYGLWPSGVAYFDING